MATAKRPATAWIWPSVNTNPTAVTHSHIPTTEVIGGGNASPRKRIAPEPMKKSDEMANAFPRDCPKTLALRRWLRVARTPP